MTEKDCQVAKFLGYNKPTDEDLLKYFGPGYTLERINRLEKNYIPILINAEGIVLFSDSFIFEDWNYIMEVVYVVESLEEGRYQVDILQEGCNINYRYGLLINKTVSVVPVGYTKKECVMEALYELSKIIYK